MGLGIDWLGNEPDQVLGWGRCDFLGGGDLAGWMGGGILSLGEGSSNVRQSSAAPQGFESELSNTALWPSAMETYLFRLGSGRGHNF